MNYPKFGMSVRKGIFASIKVDANATFAGAVVMVSRLFAKRVQQRVWRFFTPLFILTQEFQEQFRFILKHFFYPLIIFGFIPEEKPMLF